MSSDPRPMDSPPAQAPVVRLPVPPNMVRPDGPVIDGHRRERYKRVGPEPRRGWVRRWLDALLSGLGYRPEEDPVSRRLRD